jgi:thioredoxin-related protein
MYFTKKLLFLFIFFGCFIIHAQESKEKEVLNIFTFEEVEKLQKQKPKPILIFLYTDWCKICFGMKKTTFKNRKVVPLLNKKFYFVLFNGEEKKDIYFLGRTFKYKPTGTNTGIHELAFELAHKNKRNVYPTSVILNKDFEIALHMPGFLNNEQLLLVLNEYAATLP